MKQQQHDINLRRTRKKSPSPRWDTYIFINPRSHVTIQDAKTVSGEIEKEAKKLN